MVVCVCALVTDKTIEKHRATERLSDAQLAGVGEHKGKNHSVTADHGLCAVKQWVTLITDMAER